MAEEDLHPARLHWGPRHGQGRHAPSEPPILGVESVHAEELDPDIGHAIDVHIELHSAIFEPQGAPSAQSDGLPLEEEWVAADDLQLAFLRGPIAIHLPEVQPVALGGVEIDDEVAPELRPVQEDEEIGARSAGQAIRTVSVLTIVVACQCREAWPQEPTMSVNARRILPREAGSITSCREGMINSSQPWIARRICVAMLALAVAYPGRKGSSPAALPLQELLAVGMPKLITLPGPAMHASSVATRLVVLLVRGAFLVSGA